MADQKGRTRGLLLVLVGIFGQVFVGMFLGMVAAPVVEQSKPWVDVTMLRQLAEDGEFEARYGVSRRQIARFFSPPLYLVGLTLFGCYITGGAIYAKAKGYSGWLGGILAFSLIGLVVLLLLPDRL